MKLRELLLGAPKSPLDPKVFERLALAAFFAWVGLGADGLSSSCYGPAEIFDVLGTHAALAPILIVAIGLTVAVLSAGYANTIEAFPGGGGGYIVASKTLGRHAGLLCGCALILDYALTISISMAAGVEAVFSFLAPGASPTLKLWVTVAATLGLMTLNLRGVKESITVLLPIFVGFLVTHTLAIGAAVVSHGSGVGTALGQSVSEARAMTVDPAFGWAGLLVILLKAYTVGSGTYTGIEAISNTVPILREPRVATAKRAMLYMGVSLAFTSGGLLLGYLLYGVAHVPGKTLNAVFLENLTAGTVFESWFAPVTLLTEGALLFVAAQAGYVSGPRAMASMAVDSWVPRWFRRLSDRLVLGYGILLVGAGAIVSLVLTGGSVKLLMLIYAFSVFVTFVLSQLGMVVYQLGHREPGWPLRLAINGTAAFLSILVVVALSVLRFKEGIWASALVIVGLMAACLLIRLYYDRIGRLLGRLDRVKEQVEAEPPRAAPPSERDAGLPTAVVLVRSYGGPGIHTVMAVLRNFPDYFRNFVFVSVGDIDFDRFKGAAAVEGLRRSVEAELQKYVDLARKWGFHAESRVALGVDVVDEAADLCRAIGREFPRSMFFAGHLVFEQPGLLTRLLHEQTGLEIQRRLQFEGLTLILLPVRVLRPRRERNHPG